MFAFVISPLIGGLITIFILFLLFAIFIIWLERGRFKWKAEAKERAMEILKKGEIEDMEEFEYICRVLLIAQTSVLHSDTQAAELYKCLRALKDRRAKA